MGQRLRLERLELLELRLGQNGLQVMLKNVLMAFAALAAAAIGVLAGAALLSHDKPAPDTVVDRAKGGSMWGAEYFPNVSLVTHEGETVRFFDDLLKDKVVAISFMYTSCPDTCPVETARLLQVARLLGDRLGHDIFFYSITIDPEHDTQPVLKAFADSWKIPYGWTFLTGAEKDIILIRKRLGMRLDDVASGDFADHTVNLLIGNQKTGRWMKRSPFENAYFLASQLGSWLHGWKMPSPNKLDYADAPEIRPISDGEYIFRNECSSCHTIGGGDVRTAAYIGPDLVNVTRVRDRKWLERWLAEPDAMLEEGDPLATALYEQWNRFPMPNLRLTEVDVTALLGYIERESQRLAAVRAGKLADPSEHAGHAGHGEHGGHEGHGEHGQHSAHTGGS